MTLEELIKDRQEEREANGYLTPRYQKLSQLIHRLKNPGYRKEHYRNNRNRYYGYQQKYRDTHPEYVERQKKRGAKKSTPTPNI
jgi:hypothetical protein